MDEKDDSPAPQSLTCLGALQNICHFCRVLWTKTHLRYAEPSESVYTNMSFPNEWTSGKPQSLFFFSPRVTWVLLCVCFVTGWLTYVQFGTLEFSFPLQTGREPSLVLQGGGWMRQRQWVGLGPGACVWGVRARKTSCLLPLLFDERRFFAWPLESSEGTSSSSPQSATEQDLKALLCKRLALWEHLLLHQQMPSASLALPLSWLPTLMENSGNSLVCDPRPP